MGPSFSYMEAKGSLVPIGVVLWSEYHLTVIDIACIWHGGECLHDCAGCVCRPPPSHTRTHSQTDHGSIVHISCSQLQSSKYN